MLLICAVLLCGCESRLSTVCDEVVGKEGGRMERKLISEWYSRLGEELGDVRYCGGLKNTT